MLVSHAFIDYNKVDLPLRVRSWRPGDRIRPLGFHGRKKVQDLFVDEKIPRLRRDNIPLIISGNKVVWVAGLRIDDKYRVDEQTRQILHLWIDHSDPAEIPVTSDVGHVSFAEGDENEMDPDFP
ncbi:MAG: tRNA lysidine(34) synthetase TilS [Bacillota bacterium]